MSELRTAAMADTAEYFRRKARTGHAADGSLADLGVQPGAILETEPAS